MVSYILYICVECRFLSVFCFFSLLVEARGADAFSDILSFAHPFGFGVLMLGWRRRGDCRKNGGRRDGEALVVLESFLSLPRWMFQLQEFSYIQTLQGPRIRYLYFFLAGWTSIFEIFIIFSVCGFGIRNIVLSKFKCRTPGLYLLSCDMAKKCKDEGTNTPVVLKYESTNNDGSSSFTSLPSPPSDIEPTQEPSSGQPPPNLTPSRTPSPFDYPGPSQTQTGILRNHRLVTSSQRTQEQIAAEPQKQEKNDKLRSKMSSLKVCCKTHGFESFGVLEAALEMARHICSGVCFPCGDIGSSNQLRNTHLNVLPLTISSGFPDYWIFLQPIHRSSCPVTTHGTISFCFDTPKFFALSFFASENIRICLC